MCAVDDLQSLLGVDGNLVVKGVHTDPCQEMPCCTKVRVPEGLGAAGLSRELKNPKKTSYPHYGKRFWPGALVESPWKQLSKQAEKGLGTKLRAYRCGCPQPAVIEAPTALVALMRFLSLRLVPKAARAPKMGKGPGTSGGPSTTKE